MCVGFFFVIFCQFLPLSFPSALLTRFNKAVNLFLRAGKRPIHNSTNLRAANEDGGLGLQADTEPRTCTLHLYIRRNSRRCGTGQQTQRCRLALTRGSCWDTGKLGLFWRINQWEVLDINLSWRWLLSTLAHILNKPVKLDDVYICSIRHL